MSPDRWRRTGAALVVAALLGVAFPPVLPASHALSPPPAPVLEEQPAGWPAPEHLDAAAYVLVEAADGQVLAADAAEERRPVASTIKVLTAFTVVQRAELDEQVTVGEEVLDVGGASVGLEVGDTWTVEELLDAAIGRSGNEATEALAVHVAGSSDAFLELMRADARELGVDGATLVSVSGLDDGNLLSALDLATVARAALADERLRPLLARRLVNLPGTGALESRNELLEIYPDATGVKTGFTQAAGNSVIGSARRGDRELVAVVLGSGEDPQRFEAAASLLDLGFDAYERTRLGASLRFVLAGGHLDVEVAPLSLTVPDGLPADLRLPLRPRPPEGPLIVEVVVGGEIVSAVEAALVREITPPGGDGAALGRAAVDGAYAALRAAAATEVLR